MPDIRVKICGLRTLDDVAAVAATKAAYIGLNFFPKSPRYVSLAEARVLALAAPIGLAKVALVVDADDALLDAITEAMPLDILQLHGHETPDRVAEIRARYGLPVMKVIGVRDEGDLAELFDFSTVADQIMIDAKAPKDAILPGGNGVPFDWRLVAQRRWLRPWMLAGGLTPDNVAEAIRLTNARQVDVSSGVESSHGVKDPSKISAFVQAATQDGPPILR
ncbi:MAG: phosphoribosylanthranilate isomerase [Pseudomonadota bacterium]